MGASSLKLSTSSGVSGNPLFMLLIGFFYVAAAQSIGLLLFTFTGSAITAYSLIGILVSIAMTYSGMAVPELSMRWAVRGSRSRRAVSSRLARRSA